MSDGNNLPGFNETKPAGSSPWATENYTDALASAFASTDMSSQGNAGLNREGSSSSLPISGADESDM
jgi:hypothetical protein